MVRRFEYYTNLRRLDEWKREKMNDDFFNFKVAEIERPKDLEEFEKLKEKVKEMTRRAMNITEAKLLFGGSYNGSYTAEDIGGAIEFDYEKLRDESEKLRRDVVKMQEAELRAQRSPGSVISYDPKTKMATVEVPSTTTYTPSTTTYTWKKKKEEKPKKLTDRKRLIDL